MIIAWLFDLRRSWNRAWRLPAFKIQILFAFLTLLILATFVHRYFNYVQLRPGFRIDDPLLNFIPPYEMSFYTFGLIYPAIIIGLISLIKFPFKLLYAMQAYGLLVLMRMATLYVVPLEPDRSLILLTDPFIAFFFNVDTNITKDLFFSGHVSTLFLLVLMAPYQFLKYFFSLVTILVALLLLIQHVHYTLDVVIAPIFSWASYKAVGFITIQEVPHKI